MTRESYGEREREMQRGKKGREKERGKGRDQSEFGGAAGQQEAHVVPVTVGIRAQRSARWSRKMRTLYLCVCVCVCE